MGWQAALVKLLGAAMAAAPGCLDGWWPVEAGLELVGRYVIEELIGRGGMGEVWRGTDKELGRPVAVKVMLGSLAANREAAARFRREARTAARLSHPGNVVV